MDILRKTRNALIWITFFTFIISVFLAVEGLSNAVVGVISNYVIGIFGSLIVSIVTLHVQITVQKQKIKKNILDDLAIPLLTYLSIFENLKDETELSVSDYNILASVKGHIENVANNLTDNLFEYANPEEVKTLKLFINNLTEIKNICILSKDEYQVFEKLAKSNLIEQVVKNAYILYENENYYSAEELKAKYKSFTK